MKRFLKSIYKPLKTYTVSFVKWLVLGLGVGIVGGVVGTVFAKTIAFVTALRLANDWLILLLPLGGVVSVAIYKLFKVTGVGTNQVFESVRTEKKVPYLLAPAIFVGAAITHLFGGSAGREGAALQLGGSVASALGGLLHLDKKTQHILTMCGMAAFFSALFGTPVGAGVFALEVVSVGHFCSAAFFPVVVSSVSAYAVGIFLGSKPEFFSINNVPNLSVDSVWRVVVIAIAGALVSVIFCKLIHFSDNSIKSLIKNEYIRIIVGGVVLVGLTASVGSQHYNGGGLEIVEKIFTDGEVNFEAFLLKILFTVITISVGFKGGEIVPTFYIGATLGATVGVLVGVSPALGAAVGMAAMFSGVTNCPLSTIILSFELFKGQGFIFCAIAAVISFMLSGNVGLYEGQRLVYSKLQDEVIDVNAG
ncbi:MAG: chloride channel protein [Clostridia bacterium]|nr:chloride channel protein [Clostridia bacterium]